MFTYEGRIKGGKDGLYNPEMLKAKFPSATDSEQKDILEYFNSRGGTSGNKASGKGGKGNKGGNKTVDFFSPATYDAVEFEDLPKIIKVIEGVIEKREIAEIKETQEKIATLQKRLDILTKG